MQKMVNGCKLLIAICLFLIIIPINHAHAARIFTSGFEVTPNSAGFEWSGSLSGVTQVTSPVRSGTYADQVNFANDTQYGNNVLPTLSSGGIYYERFYINITTSVSANTPIADLVAGVVFGAVLKLNTDDTLSVYSGSVSDPPQIGSNSAAMSKNAWHRVEFSYNFDTGAVEAKIDGTVFASGTGTASVAVNTVEFGGGLNDINVVSGQFTYDDFAINDNSGSAQTSYPGDSKIIILRPSAAGDVNTFATQTGGTAGAANNFTRVQEIDPDDASSFNGSSALNQEDLFNVDDSGIGSSDVVNVVQVGGRFRNSTADTTATIKFEIEKTSAGTITQSSGITPNSTTWKSNARVSPLTTPITLYVDPDGSAWTKTTLDSMQIGYKLTTAPAIAGRRVDVSDTWAYVDYTPSSGTVATSTCSSNSLVGWWTFNGSDISGTTALDRSGSVDNGTLTNGPTLTAGKIGQALSFSGGSSQYVDFGASYNGIKTISLWYKASSLTQKLIDLNGTASIAISGGSVITNGFSGLVYVDGVQTPTISTVNVWHHIIVTYAENSINASAMKLGVISSTYFTGSIDDLRIYSCALPPYQALALYNSSNYKINITPSTFFTPLRSSITGWWTMDGMDTNWTSGLVTDKSGAGGSANLIGFSTSTSPVGGKLGQALSFNGSTQYLTSSSVLSGVMTSSAGTVSVWFYPIGGQTTGCTTGDMSGLVGDGTVSGGFMWLGYDGSNVCVGGFDSAKRSFSAAASSGKWNHAVWVHQNGSLSLWVNGNFAGATALGTISDLTHAIHIGRSFSSAYFKGYIDDVRMYNYSVSSSTIQQLYQSGAGTKRNLALNMPNSPLQNGLVGWWTFDGKDMVSGRLIDRSPTASTGYLFNIATSTFFTIGKIGQGFKFDRVNDHIDTGVSYSHTYLPTSNLTITAWIKLKDLTNEHAIIGQRNGGGFSFYVEGPNVGDPLGFSIFGVADDFSDATGLQVDKWAHVAVTYDRSFVRFYVNGVFLSQTARVEAITDDGIPHTFIGDNNNGDTGSPDIPFGGSMDDVRIYNRALSAKEIQQIYNFGR
jgi:hypothetical protein